MKMKLAMAAGALAAMLAAGAAGAQGEAPTVVAVQLSEFSYSPTTIELNRGQAYVLRLTNSGAHAHDLSAKAFFHKGLKRDHRTELTPDQVRRFDRVALEKLGEECAHWLETGESASTRWL